MRTFIRSLHTPIANCAYQPLPIGLKYTGNTFQCLKEEVLRGLPFVFVYIDDILIFSHDHDDHCRHLSEVFA